MIVGYFDPLFPQQPVPRVRAGVFMPGITQDWVFIDFLLDTGASTTCLHPRDAIFAVGINLVQLALPQYWPRHEQRHGVGGGALYFPLAAHYALQHQDGQWQTIQGEIRVAQLRADNQTIDSLLGWDILQNFEVVADWPKRRIVLK